MGYWMSYTGVAFAGHALPLQRSSPTMLFSRPVVLASLLVPALALAGFAWTRRWRYGPFLLAMVLLGVVIVAAGFPEGTPLRQGLHFVYNRAQVVQFLRTSYKAAPLIMLGVAGCSARPAVRRGAGCRDAGASGAAGRGGGLARRRRMAADERRRARAALTRRSVRMAAGRRGPRPSAARQLPRDRAAEPAVLVLHVGRHG